MTENPEAAIAIVGLAGRFPGARDVSELWSNLVNGVESVGSLTDDELAAAGVAPELYTRPDYVKACAFLEDPDGFDAGFFDVTPREAEILDPQQRVFLECAWSAIEDAGYDVSRSAGSVGVFAGAGKNHYFADNLLKSPELMEALGPVATTIASEKDFVATRVSYKLDLSGPSLSVQTACSTSLVAVHLACQSLLAFECDMALAGGVSISSYRPGGYLFLDGGIFSSDGHLRAFDARADGQVGGNGAAVVLLKRLADAIEDGDTIHAVIKGSALNNDGVRKVSFNAPAVDGQAQVVAEALEVAGVPAESIGYVECHGTGTHLGDPIEVAALTQAFRSGTNATHAVGFCGIGSLKTNIGHLDAAAGAAGLIKAALALEHEVIPPSLHFESPNPELDLAASPFFVNAELTEWKRGEQPRRAGVSSFGMGGTNAHVILEEPPRREPGVAARRAPLLVLSARSEAALDQACERLADHLDRVPDDRLDLADVAFTLQMGRKAFGVRRALACADRTEAIERLRAARPAARTCSQRVLEKGRTVAFLFSGQGSQHANMTRGLYEEEPVFRAEVDRCSEQLLEPLGRDLRELFYPEPSDEEAAEAELMQTRITQPALFVVEYALARLWESAGIEPAAMLGHSIGEYVAATLAGVFELDQALELVAARGRLIGSLPEGGGMLSVPLSEEGVTPYLRDDVTVAVLNAPGMSVLAGPLDSLAAVRKALRADRIAATPLHTSHAFHSALMDPILNEFEACVRKAKPRAPSRPVISCSTGERLSDVQATDPTYWVRHLREPVRFAAGATELLRSGHVLLEVGPGQALTSLAALCVPEGEKEHAAVVPSARHPRREGNDERVFLKALGRLWCEGVELDWDALHGDERRLRVPLPTYPFEHRRYWVEPSPDAAPTASQTKHADPSRWFWVPSWRRGAPLQTATGLPESVLLFADAGGLADALADPLRSAGTRVLVVRGGSDYEANGGDDFRIDPGQGDQVLRLLDSLGGDLPNAIVHLVAADPLERDRAEETAFFGPMALAQALEERKPDGATLQFVTRGLQDVLGEAIEPEKALLCGVCKAVQAECRNLSCRSLDLGPVADGSAASIELLLGELFSGTEPVVALRRGQRWLPEVEPVRLESRPLIPIPSPHPPGEDRSGGRWLREEAVILVTGGLGGVGLALAEELASVSRSRLALFGRTGLPGRSTWAEYLAGHDEDDVVGGRIRAVQRIEAAGGEVLLLVGDVTSSKDVEVAVGQIVERFGELHGVIHAAGNPGAGLMALKTRAEAAAVLGPKVSGTRVLAQALAGRELEFFVLCSSLATALDGVGQVDYFAANAFLDAFARARAQNDPRSPVVSIGWEAWRDVGMATGTDVPEVLRRGREEALRTGLSKDEGMDVLLRSLASNLPQVLVSTRDLPRRIADQALETERLSACADGASTSSNLHERPQLETDYVDPHTTTERDIAALWGELLGIEGIGSQDDFFELGGNSLLLMQVSVRLRSAFDVVLSMRELFDSSTVTALSDRVDSMRLIGSMEHGGDVSSDGEEELRL